MANKPRTNKQDIITILAATVGGAPAPVAYSIGSTNPDRVILFPSTDSRKQIEQQGAAPTEPRGRDGRGILQMLDQVGRSLDRKRLRIEEVEAEKLLPCVEKMRLVLTEELEKHDDNIRLVLDFTGGTKMMSAALALAGEGFPGAEYAYVASRHGAKSRDKGGLGVTIDGQEKQILLENPRDVSAFSAIGDARRLSTSGAWEGAAKLLENHRDRLTDPGRKRELEAWVHLFRGYAEWDRIHYSAALKHLQAAQKEKSFDRIARSLGNRKATNLARALDSHIESLSTLVEAKQHGDFHRDLVANADRLAARGMLDEAFQRLYRTVEMVGTDTLLHEHDIDSSKVDTSKLPVRFLDEWNIRQEGPVHLTLQKCWSLLEHLGTPLAERFRELNLTAKPGSKSVLDIRNHLILTHGRRTVTSNQLQKLRYAVTSLLGIAEGELVRFPEL